MMIMVRPNKITKRNNAVPPAAINTQDNTQAVRRIPGMDYGEQQELVQQQQAAPLPKESTPNQPTQKRPFTPVDVFGQTQSPDQPITDGAPVGPGRMGATLTPVQRGDLFMRALAEGFPTSDTMSLYEDGLDQFEIGLDG
tara:strand:- start:633 stop:1052 length:420 start_codon:yes stop_codon:yes gene_type:complete